MPPLPYTIPQLKKLGLTQQELNKVAYHRRGFRSPMVGKDGVTTLRAVGITGPDGREVSVPSYLHTGAGGQLVTDPAKLSRIWGKSIQAGRWPSYSDAKQLNARDKFLERTVMQRDTNYWNSNNKSLAPKVRGK